MSPTHLIKQHLERLTKPNTPPTITHPDGTREWHNKHGQPHRTNGPAIEHSNGTLLWYQNGQLERTNGPAIIHPDGTHEYWTHGQHIWTEPPNHTKTQPSPTHQHNPA